MSKRLLLDCAGIMVDTQVAGTYVGVGNTFVGASVPVYGRLHATLQDYQMLQGLPYAGSYSTDLTATFHVECLTPGATLSFCSGATHDGLVAHAQPVGTGCGTVPPSLDGTAPVLGSASQLAMAGAPPVTPAGLIVAGGSAVWAPHFVVSDTRARGGTEGRRDRLQLDCFPLRSPAVPEIRLHSNRVSPMAKDVGPTCRR